MIIGHRPLPTPPSPAREVNHQNLTQVNYTRPIPSIIGHRPPPSPPSLAREVNHQNLMQVNCDRPVAAVVGHRPPPTLSQTPARHINKHNLISIDTSNVLIDKSSDLKALYINARSCKNKSTEINDLIIEKNADIVFITETWLKDTDIITLNALVPSGFSIIFKNRKLRVGGGVAIIYKSSLKVLPTTYVPKDYSSFEACHVKIQTPDSKVCFFSCVYRPPKSSKNVLPFSTFINDFNDLCECLSSEQNLYIFGDFNLHFENTSDPCSSQFRLLLNEHELINCNIEKTHVSGHTLDLCLFRCADSAFIDLPTFENLCLSDHFVMTASLPFSKPNHVKSTIKKRNISNIDLNSFELALNESLTNIKDELTSFSFHQCVLNVLNTFAPIKNRLTVIRPAAPWFNLVIKAQKQVRRRAERLFRKTKLTVHKQKIKFQKNKTIKIINQEKKKIYF